MEISLNFAIGFMVFLGFVFAIIVHECAHGIMAYWCGDDTAYRLGRITLDPIPHIDPFMSVIVPGMMLLASGGTMAFGGAKPVPVVPSNLRHPKRDMMWVAWAGPASNVILAVLLALCINALPLLPNHDLAVKLGIVLRVLVTINLFLACFNLIPIPPLDGSRILAGLLPDRQAAGLLSLEPFGLGIILALLMLGVLGKLLAPVYTFLAYLLNTLVHSQEAWNILIEGVRG